MSVTVTVDIIETALWPQGDARDPLGVWGARGAVTGDASGGAVVGQLQVAADKRRARIYTAYSANSILVSGTDTAGFIKLRLLTNWPDIDPLTLDVQGYGSYISVPTRQEVNATGPRNGPTEPLIKGIDRFILLFDPSAVRPNSPMVIIEMVRDVNILAAAYVFEAWGYYWDREVQNVPGGPRHPGAH